MNVLLVATLMCVCSVNAYPVSSMEDWPDYTSEELRLVPAYEREPLLIQKRSTFTEQYLEKMTTDRLKTIHTTSTTTANLKFTPSTDYPGTTQSTDADTTMIIDIRDGSHTRNYPSISSSPNINTTANGGNRENIPTTDYPGTTSKPNTDSTTSDDNTTPSTIWNTTPSITKEFPNQSNNHQQLNKIRP